MTETERRRAARGEPGGAPAAPPLAPSPSAVPVGEGAPRAPCPVELDSAELAYLALEASATGLWSWDVRGDAVSWSEECYRIHGLAPGAFAGTGAAFFALVHPEDRERVEVTVRAAIDARALYECEFRILRPGGAVAWVANRGRASYDEEGRPLRMLGTLTDITASKREADRRALLVDVARLILEDRAGDGDLAERVFQRVRGVLEADLLLSYALEEGPALRLLRSVGVPEALRHEAARLELGQALCGAVAANRQPIAADRRRIAADPAAAFLRRLQAGAYACQPLLGRDGRVLGTFSVASTTRDAFAPAELEFLQTIAHFLALALDRQRAEEALRHSEERYRTLAEHHRQAHDTFYHLIQHNPFGVYIVDAAFRLRHVSLGAQKVFSTVSPLLGRDFAEVLRILWPEPFASEAIARFRHTLSTGEPFTSPSTVERRADIDEVESYDWRIERVTLPDGEHGVVCYFYDLSERQRWDAALRQSESFYRQTLESIPGMVFTNRADGACDYVSEQWVAFTGVPAAEQRGDGWEQVLHPDDGPRARAAWQAAVEGRGTYDLEYRVRRRDGGYEWFKVRGRAIRDEGGAVVRWFGTAVNVDDLKRAEAALTAREQELQVQDRRKDEFLATLAHELRNPLAPLRNGLEIIRQRGDGDGPVARARAMMDRQLGHLVRLVDDLLDLSRVRQGQITLRRERVTAQEVMDAAVEACRPSLEEKGQALTLEPGPGALPLFGDRTRLVQVLANLLTNAAKYSEPGGRIRVAARREGDAAVLSVSDTGVGIAPELLPTIWDLFTQVRDTLDKAQGGLGIGLPLVKRLVEMHGGSATAESAGLGRGSTFTLRLPLSAPAPQLTPAAPARPAERAAAGCRVLVVDDSADGAESLAMVLELSGYEAMIAGSGPEGLELARTFRPAAVFLDIGLPGMDGYEVARRLRGDEATRGAFLVALTGWGSDEDRRRSREAGFDVHLTKPVEAEAVHAVLARLPAAP